MAGYWVAQQGVASPILPFQDSDLGRILNRTSGDLPGAVASWDLAALLRERRAHAGGGPIVVYLSAAGVSDGRRPLLLATNHRPVDTPGDANRAGLSADELLDLVSESPAEGAKCLLILDAGQIGTDRNLGVFGNGFVHRLATLMKEKKPKGLAVLCSCAPGQVSWTSEADGRAVFGHFVARGLAGEAAGWDPSSRGLSARGLAEYVRHHVARWVSEKRRAQQTPILLSADDAADFPLRPSVSPSALRGRPGRTRRPRRTCRSNWPRGGPVGMSWRPGGPSATPRCSGGATRRPCSAPSGWAGPVKTPRRGRPRGARRPGKEADGTPRRDPTGRAAFARPRRDRLGGRPPGRSRSRRQLSGDDG